MSTSSPRIRTDSGCARAAYRRVLRKAKQRPAAAGTTPNMVRHWCTHGRRCGVAGGAARRAVWRGHGTPFCARCAANWGAARLWWHQAWRQRAPARRATVGAAVAVAARPRATRPVRHFLGAPTELCVLSVRLPLCLNTAGSLMKERWYICGGWVLPPHAKRCYACTDWRGSAASPEPGAPRRPRRAQRPACLAEHTTPMKALGAPCPLARPHTN